MPFRSILKAVRVRFRGDTSTLPEGENADLSCDTHGSLYVIQKPVPDGFGDFFSNVNANNGPLAVAGQVVTQIGGFNDSTEKIYVQLFFAPSPPEAGSIPSMVFLVPPDASFSWTPSNGGYIVPNAFEVFYAVSSTRATLTPSPVEIFLYQQRIFYN